VRSERRFSQAISEGDGISVIAEVRGEEAARAAESHGAEALAVGAGVGDLRAVTELPILWRAPGGPSAAAVGGADAWIVAVEAAGDDDEWLVRQHAEAIELGLDCVVEVRSEDHIERALEHLDPEIFLLAATDNDERGGLARALELLPDLPAGKLAVADVHVSSREQIDELERAGVDAVIVGARDVADFVGHEPPQV
jgi:indole-3-glycerol phosphate synthase